jgi:putative heme-binding domain-containing protein
MRWSCYVLVFLLLPSIAAGQAPKWAPSAHIAGTQPLRPAEQAKRFHLPPGFEMQLVAADPQLRKPINIAFDAAGRLWVTETIEYPFAAAGRPGRDAVKVLEDFGPDGRARKITTFADGLNIPIGVLPLDRRTVLVYSIPSVWRLTDTDGDGKADQREELLTGFGHEDTHGMTGEFQMGFDGWVYACHGFRNKSVVKGRDGSTITMESGNTYRFKPDGTRLQHFTHGQVNPFGLTFDPLGNLYSTDCHTRPMYQLLRGAWYPSFGKPHDGLGFGPEMVTHDHGSTAIGGIAYYAAEQYPVEFRDNLFVGNVVTNRINRDRIQWAGSTPKGIEMPDFVKCDDPWFRPVDIKLGPDGCLYVADFYNRIIGHYEVPLDHPGRDRDKGRIWRIVYRGADGKAEPGRIRDLTTLEPDQLLEQFESPNLTTRLLAGNELATAASVSKPAAKSEQPQSPPARVQRLWLAQRRGNLGLQHLAEAAGAKDALIRVHAQRVLAERPQITEPERDLVLAGLKDSDAFVQRAAAEALAQHSRPENIAPLLALQHAAASEDTHLLHMVRIALRNQLRSDAAFAKIRPADLTAHDYRAIADVCLGVHNPSSAHFIKGYVQKFDERGETLSRFCHYVVRYGSPDSAVWVLNLARSRFSMDLLMQGQLLKGAMQASQERGGSLPSAEQTWAGGLVQQLLQATKNQEIQLGIDIAAGLKPRGIESTLLQLARDKKRPEALRKSAVTTLVSLSPWATPPALATLYQSDTESMSLREHVAFAVANNTPAASIAGLVKSLETLPARLQAAVALGIAGTPAGCERLLESVEAGKASPRLLQERLLEIRLKQAKLPNLEDRVARLTKSLPPVDQKVHKLLSQRKDAFAKAGADIEQGRKVFAKNCAACHQLANEGAKIGPQLDGIGIRGVERVLEDVLDPNRNVDQAFRSTVLVLDNGQIVSGLMLREEGEVVILADAQGKEVRVPKASLQERQVSPLSPMPGNYAEQIPESEFYHLLAYLLAQRPKQ